MFAIFYYLTKKKKKVKETTFSCFLEKGVGDMPAFPHRAYISLQESLTQLALASNPGGILSLLGWESCPVHIPAFPFQGFPVHSHHLLSWPINSLTVFITWKWHLLLPLRLWLLSSLHGHVVLLTHLLKLPGPWCPTPFLINCYLWSNPA